MTEGGTNKRELSHVMSAEKRLSKRGCVDLQTKRRGSRKSLILWMSYVNGSGEGSRMIGGKGHSHLIGIHDASWSGRLWL